MTDLATIERYAIAIPLRVAAGILSIDHARLRRLLVGGKSSGVKLGDQWFLRKADVTSLTQARSHEVGGESAGFLRRWSPVDPRTLPEMLDLAEVELLLAERRILLYRLLVAGSLEGVRGSDGWMVSRDALLTALAPAASRDLVASASRPRA